MSGGRATGGDHESLDLWTPGSSTVEDKVRMGVTCSTPFRTRSRFGRSVRCTPIDHRFVVNSGGVDSSSSNLKTSQRCRVNTRQVKITNTFCGSVSCFHYFSDEPYFV